MKALEKRMAAKKAMIPESGYNLVGLDDMAVDPSEELYLVDHYDTEAAALAAKSERESVDPDEKLFVYGPETG